jgi:hypothetical protein
MHDELKNRERMTELQKQQQSDLLERHMQDNKRMLQNHLANDYGNASKMKQMDKYNDKANSISADREAIDRARKEMNFINSTEAKKKEYIQQMFKNEKKLHELSLQNEKKKQMDVLREDQNSIDYSIKNLYDREAIYKSRYKNFNQIQDLAAKNFTKNVLSPETEKKSKIDRIVRKQMDERNKKLEDMERQKATFYDNWKQNTKKTIVGQMNHSVDLGRDNQFKNDYDRKERYAKQSAIDMVEQMERDQRKSLQSKYKEMLDSQRRIKSEYRSYGNMSNVEKSLNRNDLLAWKNFDYTTYAMIPGFNSNTLNLSNKVIEDKSKKSKVRDLEKETQKLKIYHTNLNHVKNQFAGTSYPPPSNDYNMVQYNTPGHKRNNSVHDRETHSNSEPRRQIGNQDIARNMSLDNIKLGSGTMYRANHPKYTKHHLYTSLDPISGILHEDRSTTGRSL